MSTSQDNRITVMKPYLYASGFLMAFDLIYEQFSHGVHSNFMRFAFVLPLLSGLLITQFLQSKDFSKLPAIFIEFGTNTFIIGFLLKGIFDIYGSVDPIVWYFFYIGSLLILGAIVSFIMLQQKQTMLRKEDES